VKELLPNWRNLERAEKIHFIMRICLMRNDYGKCTGKEAVAENMQKLKKEAGMRYVVFTGTVQDSQYKFGDSGGLYPFRIGYKLVKALGQR